MKTKYIVSRSGYLTVKGQSVEVQVGEEVSKIVYDNYPNYVERVDETVVHTKVEAVDETPIIEPEIITEVIEQEPTEPIEPVEPNIEEETVTVKKQAGRPAKNK